MNPTDLLYVLLETPGGDFRSTHNDRSIANRLRLRLRLCLPTFASKRTTLTNVNDAARAGGGSQMMPLLWWARPMQRLILEESI